MFVRCWAFVCLCVQRISGHVLVCGFANRTLELNVGAQIEEITREKTHTHTEGERKELTPNCTPMQKHISHE